MSTTESTTSDLIPVALFRIGTSDVESVDGRVLHANLGMESEYAHWMKTWIRKAHLVNHRDYEVFVSEVKNPLGGRPTNEYALTTEAAKCIAMMSGGRKGDEVRAYFIAREQQAIALEKQANFPQVKNPSNQLLIEAVVRIDALEQEQQAQRDALVAQQAELIATQQKVIEGFLLAEQAHAKAEEAEASAERAHDARDFFTVAEYMQYEYSEQKIAKREYKAISDHLQAYCLNKGKAFRRIPVGGKPWSEEYAYHRSIYDAALPGWLHRRYAQENLTVLYPDNTDHEGA
jgi:phage anti-repressor protein